MKNINIFCFGFGQIAKNFVNKMQLENFKINLSTTSTKKSSNKANSNNNYTSIFVVR